MYCNVNITCSFDECATWLLQPSAGLQTHCSPLWKTIVMHSGLTQSLGLDLQLTTFALTPNLRPAGKTYWKLLSAIWQSHRTGCIYMSRRTMAVNTDICTPARCN